MKNNLAEGSKSYHKEANIYELFSNAEDSPKKIEKFLSQKINGKIVLDIGCGNGKYAKKFAPISKKYIGLEISKEQIAIAERKTRKFKNISFINSSAEFIDLPDKSVEVVIATWAISTIRGFDRKKKALNGLLRVLVDNGEIYLIENDIAGEFEEIRGRFPELQKTKEYNDWIAKQGFGVLARFNTYFGFESLDKAKKIIGSIWGMEARAKVKSKRIEHKVIIFNKSKSP